jgi:tRNA(fMet)-specific endonuclease VapC
LIVLVLDSNTISYYFRGDPRVVPRLQAIPPAEVGVPAVVIYELLYGLQRLAGEAAQPRRDALKKLVQPMQSLAFDAACAEQAAGIRRTLEQQGITIGAHDVLIAATALHHRAPLVTRNVREFSRVPGLQVINWHGD